MHFTSPLGLMAVRIEGPALRDLWAEVCQGARWAMWGEWTVWRQSASSGSKSQAAGPGCCMIECRWKGWQQVLREGCDWGLGLWILQRRGPSAPITAGLRCPGVSTPQSPSWSLYLVLEPRIPEFPKEIARLDNFFMETPFPAYREPFWEIQSQWQKPQLWVSSPSCHPDKETSLVTLTASCNLRAGRHLRSQGAQPLHLTGSELCPRSHDKLMAERIPEDKSAGSFYAPVLMFLIVTSRSLLGLLWNITGSETNILMIFIYVKAVQKHLSICYGYVLAAS